MIDGTTLLIARSALAVCLLSASGCAGLNQMSRDFEERWNDPGAVLADTPKTLTDEQKQAMIGRVDAYLANGGDCEKIEPTANQILTFDEVNTDALLTLGECRLKARDVASARTHFTTVTKLRQDARALRGLGSIALMEEDASQAKTHLFKSVQLNSGDWKTWNNLGYAEDLLQNWDEAGAAYRRAASLNAAEPAPLNNLGMSLLRQEKFSEAIATFKTALYRDPSLEIAELNMRVAQAMSGDYANAMAGASENQRATILNNVGVAAMARGEHKVAVEMFRDALDANPVFYSVAYNNLERAQIMRNQE